MKVKKQGVKILLSSLFMTVLISSSICSGTANAGVSVDLNGDKVVNMSDVILLASAFNSVNGDPKYKPAYDLNSDGSINMSDVIILAAKFNTTINDNETVSIPWDWAGVVGTGQSLAVGAEAGPARATSQPYNNLKISLENVPIPPLDPTNSAFKMVPLVEPIRPYGIYNPPGPYPGNIFGETPHTAMANQITSLVRASSGKDYITVHTVVGESGQGIDCLKKGAVDTGSTGRAFAATLFEVKAIERIAAAAGKTYGVGAIVITHGEKDSGNTSYENELHTLWSDYNQDIKAITGQLQSIPLILTQQHSCGSSGTSASLYAQWKAGVDYPGDIICSGPNYQHTYASDGVHMTASGYEQLGEQYAKVYYEKVVLGHDWQPLQPTSVEKSGKVITVNLHVPVPPLVWDTTLPAPNQNVPEWKNGKGFEVYTQDSKITISSVEISGNSVKITCANDIPASGVKVGFAFTGSGTKRENGTYRWGLLRDSDTFKGATTGLINPNFCVSFELPVP
ncbi:MAG: dockerin type I domain-containing protein [Bacillota bacterium]|nr:dockerin type I domain-containing protein [Bacillota bacterium]